MTSARVLVDVVLGDRSVPHPVLQDFHELLQILDLPHEQVLDVEPHRLRPPDLNPLVRGRVQQVLYLAIHHFSDRYLQGNCWKHYLLVVYLQIGSADRVRSVVSTGDEAHQVGEAELDKPVAASLPQSHILLSVLLKFVGNFITRC